MLHTPPTVEEILANASSLRRLALAAARGDGEADDVVQEAWLAAVRRPPERGAGRPLGPWLAGAVRNIVRLRARGRVRAARREEQVASEGDRVAPSPEALLSRLEVQRLVAARVAALAEPYRSTVLLRYFEEMSSPQIARAQGIPEGTVRWRLKTALDRLRAELDAEMRGDRNRWLLAIAPITWPRVSLAPAPGIGLRAAGGIAMATGRTKLTLALAALIAALGGAWLLTSSRPGGVAVEPPASRRSTGGRWISNGVPRPVPANASAEPVELSQVSISPAVVEPDPAPNGAFEGIVLNGSSGRPVVGASVAFLQEGAAMSVVTDGRGRFRFEPLRAAPLVLSMVTATGYLPFAPELGTSPIALRPHEGARVGGITINLTPALDYTALVVDPSEHPVAGALVRVIGGPLEASFAAEGHELRSNPKGEVTFHAPDDAIVEARHTALGVGRARLDSAATLTHRLTIKLDPTPDEALAADRSIAGTVVDGSGAPIDAAIVMATRSPGSARGERGADLSPPRQALSDPSGRFVIDGLDRGGIL